MKAQSIVQENPNVIVAFPKCGIVMISNIYSIGQQGEIANANMLADLLEKQIMKDIGKIKEFLEKLGGDLSRLQGLFSKFALVKEGEQPKNITLAAPEIMAAMDKAKATIQDLAKRLQVVREIGKILQ
ncbi:hypothetical protein ACJX0J_012927, partial [Zea mays]